MTAHTCTAVRDSAGAKHFAAVTGMVARLFSAIRREMEIVRAQRALEAMSDEMLRDMGIDRHQIDLAARQGRSEHGRRWL